MSKTKKTWEEQHGILVVNEVCWACGESCEHHVEIEGEDDGGYEVTIYCRECHTMIRRPFGEGDQFISEGDDGGFTTCSEEQRQFEFKRALDSWKAIPILASTKTIKDEIK